MTVSIGSRLGPYEITAKLGEGGMGEVYRATDTKLRRDVAIKVLPAAFTEDKERLARFEREAQLLAQLNHPNIAAIYALEKWGQLPISATGSHASGGAEKSETVPIFALVLELVEGPTLAERLEQGPLPFNESLSVSLQIAQALEEAHEKGIVHRDLKPQNVKASMEGKVKVLDFGLAKAMDPAAGSPASAADLARSPTLMQSPTLTAAHGTQLGVILGTAAYMAPEQAAGGAVDRRADVWSFGVVLYEMLTGRRLFEGDTVSHVLAGVLKDEPDFSLLPAETPPRIRRLLRRCLRKKPRERLQAIGDARIVIEEVLAGVVDEPASSAVEASATPRRSPWPTRIALALLALATSGLGVKVALDRTARPRVVRSSLLPPAGVSFYLDGLRPGPPALSPDGRTIVFTGASDDGRHTLWVRAVDALAPRELPSTEGAQYPFWSPDSRQIGYFTDAQLKKVPLAGGPPVTIAENEGLGKGGAWSPRGVIVFTPAFNRPLSMVSENGGKVAPVTAFVEGGDELSHRHPRLLPDGRHFLYVVRRAEKPSELRVGAIDGSPPVPLFETESGAEFADGHLLFVRESTLLAQPFDPDSFRLSGAATPLVENVLRLGGASFAAFTVSREGTLAYVAGALAPRSRLAWRDRDGRENGTLGEPDWYEGPRLSPDGESVVIEASDSEQGRGLLWIYELRRGIRSRFAMGEGGQYDPVWSPDGQTIAFSTNSGGQGRRLRAAPVDGTAPPRDLSAGRSSLLAARDWSPDGRFLVAWEFGAGAQVDLLLVPAEGGEPRPLIANPEVSEFGGAVSPDGRWLAFSSNESGRDEVYVTSFPTPGRKWQISQNGGGGARWRGDGRELFYTDNSALFSAAVDGSGPLFAVGVARRLFDLPFKIENLRYDVTRDGQLFLLVEPLAHAESVPITLVQNWDAELPDP